MKILLIWDNYDTYLRYFYDRHAGIAQQSYQVQLDALVEDFSQWPSYLVPAFRAVGHEADLIIGNAAPLQQSWAREHGFSFDERHWHLAIVAEQIRRYKPDVLWLVGANHYLGDFLQAVKPSCKRVVVWKAASFSPKLDWSGIDCVLSSHMNFVEQFRRMGLHSEQLLPCFDQRILQRLASTDRAIELSFSGSLNAIDFKKRLELLSYVQRRVPIALYTDKPIWRRRPLPLRDFLGQAALLTFLLRARRHAAVFGLEMFNMLHRSKIVLNAHGEIANKLAGNIRMFEATGVGTLLLTEMASNLSQLFEPDREVLTYASKEEALEKIHYCLAHEQERRAIANAGQRRTLRDHNSRVRVQEVVEIFQNTLR